MTYHPTLGTFIERDPIGYGDGMNLYEYVGSNPVNFVDPMGLASVRTDVKLYTLVRDSAKPRATLTAKEDFSARVLANALMMSATDVDKWLLDDKGAPVTDGMLRAGRTYTVPNLIIIDKGQYAPLAALVLVPAMWKSLERTADALRAKYGYSVQKNENVKTTRAFMTHLRNPDLFGFGFVGHGAGQGIFVLDAAKGKLGDEKLEPSSQIVAAPSGDPVSHHRLAYMWLMACSSLEPALASASYEGIPSIRGQRRSNSPGDLLSPWLLNMSENGELVGFTRVVNLRVGSLEKQMTVLQGGIMFRGRPPTSRPAGPTTQPTSVLGS